MKRLLFLLVVMTLVAVLAVNFGLRSYQIFTHEELIVVIEQEPAPANSGFDFQLRVLPMIAGKEGQVEVYGIYGDQWMVGGEYLKWHPWLNMLGLRNRYKLTRLSGRYYQAADEQNGPRSVYNLNGGTSPAWFFLYKVQEFIPFVQAVYGNAAYTVAQPGAGWEVSVGYSGYLIEPIRSRFK